MKSIICNEWENLVKAIHLNDAPEVQRREMKRAFFGGFASALGVMAEIEEGVEEETFMYIHKELNEFAGSVLRGDA